MKGTKGKSEKGITLIALVITIIVLLLLAGITISMLSGENGILSKAAEAKSITGEATIEEAVKLAILESLTTDGKIDDAKFREQLSKNGIGDDIVKDNATGGYTVIIGDKNYEIDENGTMKPTDNSGTVESVATPELALSGSTLTITGDAEQYKISINGVETATITATGSTTTYTVPSGTVNGAEISVVGIVTGKTNSAPATTTYIAGPSFTVTTYPGYVPVGTEATEGGTLVLVRGDAANGYEYDGQKMYWDEQHGGVYSWIVEGSVNAEDVKSFITVSENATAPIVIPVGCNVNGYTTMNDKIDFYDVTAAHACSQGRFVITDFMQGYLRADVNGDKVIDQADIDTINNHPDYDAGY